MKRTVKLYRPEHYKFEDGTVLDRDEVTVEPFGKTVEDGKERTVWADVDDDSCLYILAENRIWKFYGDLI